MGGFVFHAALVEDTLANCARHITLYGQDPKHDMKLSGSRVHYGTAGAAVHVVDVKAITIANPIWPIFMTPRALSKKWIISISFSARWWHATSPTHATLTSIPFMRGAGTTKHVGVSFTEAIIWARH
jgi:trimethylamine--corrinoid protein Co-methyltransferase